MNILFELSKDHDTLPSSEILCCLKAEDIAYSVVEKNKDVVIVDLDCSSDKIKKLSRRLSSVFFIDSYLFSSSLNIKKIEEKAEKTPISINGTIAVRYKNRSDKKIYSQDVVKALARVYTKNNEVSLKNPDNEIRALITDEKVYVGLKLFEVNRSVFEERKVQNRPFFSPISLHPKVALALVNLSCVKTGEILLDPFCGTGGILLEAGILGVKVIGSDIESKMVEGCRQTLEEYNVKDFDLFCADVGDISSHVELVDVVVTDLPYGRSTTTKGEEMSLLYNRAFASIKKVLKKGKTAVIGLSDTKSIKKGEQYFKLLGVYEFRAHKSLTRYFAVFEK